MKNQSLALGVDHTLSSTLLADFRFGWFQYDVNVLPFDFGTTPATDAGIPGLNFDNTFTSGLPAFFIGDGEPPGFDAGSGLGVNRCNCPLDQDEKQWQIGRQRHEDLGQPQLQVRHRRAARLQPARAVRQPPLG